MLLQGHCPAHRPKAKARARAKAKVDQLASNASTSPLRPASGHCSPWASLTPGTAACSPRSCRRAAQSSPPPGPAGPGWRSSRRVLVLVSTDPLPLAMTPSTLAANKHARLATRVAVKRKVDEDLYSYPASKTFSHRSATQRPHVSSPRRPVLVHQMQGPRRGCCQLRARAVCVRCARRLL